MSACLQPDQRVKRTKNFLNDHVATIRKLQRSNILRKNEACGHYLDIRTRVFA